MLEPKTPASSQIPPGSSPGESFGSLLAAASPLGGRSGLLASSLPRHSG